MSKSGAKSVEERAEEQFGLQLAERVRTTDFADVILTVVGSDPGSTAESIDAYFDDIRDKVRDDWSTVAERLEPAINRWKKAEEDRGDAEKLLEDRLSVRTLRLTATVTLVAMTLAIAAIVWLAIEFSAAWLFAGYALFLIATPWLIVVGRRGKASKDLAVDIRQRAVKGAEERFRDALRDQLPVAIREAINRKVESFDDTFLIYDESGLRELADPEREVSTKSSLALEDLVHSLDSGSIGLAGARGAGKTTLIQSFATGRSVPLEKERIGLVVSAPVKYDALEFVLHLFGQLCKEVIGEDGLEERGDLVGRSITLRRRAGLARIAMLLGALVLTVGVLMVFSQRVEPPGVSGTALTLIVIGFFALYFGFLVYVVSDSKSAKSPTWLPGDSRSRPRPMLSPERIASDRLEEISFQQSVSTGWSGGLKLPLGLGLEGNVSTTSTRTPWSLPQAVDEFRRFASSQVGGAYLVIGIDELDKMESDSAAREFLNDVKGVFGVHNCYYLVSVSEDAMSTFERRGLPFRDVFDSSFDAIQRVDFLTLEESRGVLESRVTGLPVPFQYLCHALAGGLPRDLIRVARELMRVAQARLPDGRPAPTDLAPISAALMCSEHAKKMAAALTATGAIPGPRGEWLAVWLSGQGSRAKTSEGLRRWTAELGLSQCLEDQSTGGDEKAEKDRPRYEARQIAGEVAAFNYYAATVMDLFGGGRLKRIGGIGLDPRAVDAIKEVARARQQFSISPWLAWDTLDRLRDEDDDLTLWADPREGAVVVASGES